MHENQEFYEPGLKLPSFLSLFILRVFKRLTEEQNISLTGDGKKTFAVLQDLQLLLQSLIERKGW